MLFFQRVVIPHIIIEEFVNFTLFVVKVPEDNSIRRTHHLAGRFDITVFEWPAFVLGSEFSLLDLLDTESAFFQ